MGVAAVELVRELEALVHTECLPPVLAFLAPATEDSAWARALDPHQ